jgi:hypothetical protein
MLITSSQVALRLGMVTPLLARAAIPIILWNDACSRALEFKGSVLGTAKRPETGLDWTGNDRTAVASCLI